MILKGSVKMVKIPMTKSAIEKELNSIPVLKIPNGSHVFISEKQFKDQINLRIDLSDDGNLDALGNLLDVDVPIVPNTVNSNGDVSVLWLGTDEWLILTTECYQDSMLDKLVKGLVSKVSSIVDVSGSQTVITLDGPNSRNLLAKGCTLDLHPRVFCDGKCAQTIIAKTGVMIRKIDNSQSYDLIVRRSYAEYLVLWIKDAVREYGLAVAK
jgi:sarcosine oxidase subunit gamma